MGRTETEELAEKRGLRVYEPQERSLCGLNLARDVGTVKPVFWQDHWPFCGG